MKEDGEKGRRGDGEGRVCSRHASPRLPFTRSPRPPVLHPCSPALCSCFPPRVACKVAPRSPVWLFPCSSKESVRRRSLRMSTDSASAERAAAAAAQEYPDRTGWKPDNPYLAVFRPFIPSSAHLRELTPVPLIVGTLLGIVFGASSLYLVLKVGLTVSASIPVAVISITLFRALSKIRIIPSTVRYVLAFLSLILGA